MELIVRGHNLKITQAIRDYAQKKLNKFEEFFEQIKNVVLELEVRQISERGRAHVAKINIKLPKHVVLWAEVATADIYASIDELVDKIDTPLKKYHDKFKNAHKRVNFFSKVRRLLTREQAQTSSRMVITKEPKAAPKPMDPVEAVLQLNKSKRSFYVFNNSKTHHQISIVYDRKNGSYGLQTFRDMYLKRAKLKKFVDMPADQKYEGNGVKITKIKDINAKAMDPQTAAVKLAESEDLSFLTFLNPDDQKINVIYKKKQPLSFGLIEPSM